MKKATLTLAPVLIGFADLAHAQSDSTSRPSRGERIFIRSLVGYVGAIPLLVAGAQIGFSVQRAYYPELSGDDSGMWGMVVGGMTGAVIGGAIFAPIPRLGSSCSFGRRLARSTVRTAVVFAVGAAGAYVASERPSVVLWVAPLSPIISASVQGRC